MNAHDLKVGMKVISKGTKALGIPGFKSGITGIIKNIDSINGDYSATLLIDWNDLKFGKHCDGHAVHWSYDLTQQFDVIEEPVAMKAWDKFSVGDRVKTVGERNGGIIGWKSGIVGIIKDIQRYDSDDTYKMVIEWEFGITKNIWWYKKDQLELIQNKPSIPEKTFYVSHGVSIWDLVDKDKGMK